METGERWAIRLLLVWWQMRGEALKGQLGFQNVRSTAAMPAGSSCLGNPLSVSVTCGDHKPEGNDSESSRHKPPAPCGEV